MEKSNTNKKTNIIFPRNSGFVISEIMKKYNLNETKEQILEKIKTGEDTLARKIAKIVRQVAEGTLSIEQFPFETQKTLDIPLVKAKKICLELYQKVIILAEKFADKTTAKKITGSTIKIKPAPKEFIEKTKERYQPVIPTKKQQPRKQEGEDRYRETIE